MQKNVNTYTFQNFKFHFHYQVMSKYYVLIKRRSHKYAIVQMASAQSLLS